MSPFSGGPRMVWGGESLRRRCDVDVLAVRAMDELLDLVACMMCIMLNVFQRDDGLSTEGE